ncbi:MAG: carboxypeptidase M32 [Candidatus Gottesmanbacteria bacterium]
MQDKLKQLKNLLAQVMDLTFSVSILDWDQNVYMPSGGAEARGYCLGTLQTAAHNILVSDEVQKLLEELIPWSKEQEADSDDVRLIRVTQRMVARHLKIPASMVAEKAQIHTLANQVWQKARMTSDWKLFEPEMNKIVVFAQRFAELFAPYDHVYDGLLDEYEPGMRTTDVQALFDQIRPEQVALVGAIAKQTKIDNSVLTQHYPEALQLTAVKEVINRIGYDFRRGRMDRTVHPFMSTLGFGDQRITYRVNESYFNTLFFALMHESGHGMYEQGIDASLARTPLYTGASMALHESQSRLWENLVGRSMPFWQWYYPQLQRLFPTQVGIVDLQTWYRAINKVQPSFIRVEADEATYNLHIMLRLEIEIGLLQGTIAVADLPEVWNEMFKSYLGITPPSDDQGVLQDVHWSMGLFGYFSTYALGNLVSAQLWEKINEQLPNLDEQIARGKFDELLAWLTKNVYQHGNKFEPQELVQRVTGSKIDGKPYINYLNKKFGAIYGL